MQGKNLYPDWLDQKLFPFTSQKLEINGNIIHYIDEGKGPVLLLLHGNPTWSFLYRHIVLKLASHFRCIALDYPGFGLSIPKADYHLPRVNTLILLKSLLKGLFLLTCASWCRIGVAQLVLALPGGDRNLYIRLSSAIRLLGRQTGRKA